MTRFVKVFITALVAVKSLHFANAEDNFEFREVRLELDPKAEGGEDVLVVNKATEFGVQKPYIKYALFQENKHSYFHATAVTFRGNNIKVKGSKLSQQYIYDVYTYWRGDALLLLAFRYYESEYKSLYKYFMNRTRGWESVDGEIFKADRKGLISVDNITELLRWIEEKNEVKPEQLRKKDNTRRTVVLVGVVLGVIAALGLVALLLFLRR